MREQHLCTGILQDEMDLVAFLVPVDRHQVSAQLRSCDHRLKQAKIIAHQQRDRVIFSDARRNERRGKTCSALAQHCKRNPPVAKCGKFRNLPAVMRVDTDIDDRTSHITPLLYCRIFFVYRGFLTTRSGLALK